MPSFNRRHILTAELYYSRTPRKLPNIKLITSQAPVPGATMAQPPDEYKTPFSCARIVWVLAFHKPICMWP